MKISIKTILAVASLSLAVTACKKNELLNPKSTSTILYEDAFKTPDRIKGQILGLYTTMKNGQFYGGRYLIYQDVRGEEFINNTSNLVTASDVWAQNPTNSASSVQNLWSQAYYAINNANIFLDGIDGVGRGVVSDSLASNYKGEAKFVRALAYYSLLQFYARPYADGSGSKLGVPLRLTPLTASGHSDLKRSTVAEVYTQILKDLNEAETLLPSKYASATDNTTRAHRNTAIALKTRVYLAQQKYAEVITEAQKIVSGTTTFTATTGVAHALQPDITTLFGASYTTTESILSFPMSNTAGDYPGTQNQLAYYYLPSALGGNGEYNLNPTGIIANPAFAATDRRRALIATSGGKQWLAKYAKPNPYTDWVPAIRYAEVLLNYAEAKARTSTGVDATALALLNAVRGRSNPAGVYTAASFATQTDLVNAILLERRIEFLGEGFRNSDILRLLQTFPAKGTAQAKAPTDAGYIWPISATELANNSLMVDN